ncbi:MULTISPECIES: SCO0930 family lipoprotein [Streptomyces]|uniref:Lipoprotein n=1 Tax=Streptomyces viridochromogenes TaxID=1938 RepID=A0A0L8JD79_STRVR|nr:MULTISPECIES: SCO0930 family lipoprotein [Streptomyces]KOG11605.1 lipoprotein [Streptomyces viridochromogenes]
MRMARVASVMMAASALLVTAGCGSGGEKDGPDTVTQSGAAAPAAKPNTRPAGQLSVWPHEQFGKVLTDGAGFTLYRFDKDTALPSKSRCDNQCATAWPPVPAGDATVSTGVDAKLIGQVTRSDGTKQLTVAGWPVYRFAQDTKPKDIKGQGVGGVWFAVTPEGGKAQGAAARTAAPSGPPDTGSAPPAPAAPAPSTPAPEQSTAGLAVRQDPKLGPIVVNAQGMTVYRFTKDVRWPMKSNCTGDCLTNWPVVGPVNKTGLKGITLKNFLVLDRPDGIPQQTIDCWPIYTFAADTKPGDTTGQGVGGVWYAVSPEGKLVGAPQ